MNAEETRREEVRRQAERAEEARRHAERTKQDAIRQAQREKAANMGPANTHTWSAELRQVYEAEHARKKK